MPNRFPQRLIPVLPLVLLGGACDDGMQPTAATVAGTLTLPAVAPDKPFGVLILTMPGATPVAQTAGRTGAATALTYTIAGVPAGTYFVVGFVDVDESGGDSSTPGDFAGWYGHTGSGNPPSAANAVVPASGTATFDFTLVQR